MSSKEKRALKSHLLAFIHSEGLVLANVMPSGSMQRIIGQLPALIKITCFVTRIGRKKIVLHSLPWLRLALTLVGFIAHIYPIK